MFSNFGMVWYRHLVPFFARRMCERVLMLTCSQYGRWKEFCWKWTFMTLKIKIFVKQII